METLADGPPRRLGYKLRAAHREASSTARRASCASCGRRRLCAPVDLADPGLYCLAGCWCYQLGLVHGERAAAATLARLFSRDLDRVFNPAALEASGWPVYRCDGCGETAPDFTTAGELRELGWQELGRDAHLCPACQPGRVMTRLLLVAATLGPLLAGGSAAA